MMINFKKPKKKVRKWKLFSMDMMQKIMSKEEIHIRKKEILQLSGTLIPTHNKRGLPSGNPLKLS